MKYIASDKKILYAGECLEQVPLGFLSVGCYINNALSRRLMMIMNKDGIG